MGLKCTKAVAMVASVTAKETEETQGKTGLAKNTIDDGAVGTQLVTLAAAASGLALLVTGYYYW